MEQELTVLEAARILGVHPESVKRWIRYGELHATKRGMVYYLTRSDLESFQLLRHELEELKKSDHRLFWTTPQGEFIDRVGEQLDGILTEQSLCLLALKPGGPFLAEHLARYLELVKARRPAILALNPFEARAIEETLKTRRDIIKGRKLIIIDDDTRTGDSYRAVTSILFALERDMGFDEFFIDELSEFFEIIVAPFLTGQLADCALVETARKIPLAVHTDTRAIASFFVHRLHFP
jgi:excisionase family DNA binding protein